MAIQNMKSKNARDLAFLPLHFSDLRSQYSEESGLFPMIQKFDVVLHIGFGLRRGQTQNTAQKISN